jgi:purine-nucleoside phosphorylase
MKRGIPEYFALAKYGIAQGDIARLFLRCEAESIQEKVIITPIWYHTYFSEIADSIEVVSDNYLYTITYHGQTISLLRPGMGAPVVGDVVLALSCTPCRQIIFTGSFGGLTDEFSIGDLMVVTESISGDGYSNYLREGDLTTDSFLKPANPDPGLTGILEKNAQRISTDNGVTVHKGRVFSSDSILGEYSRLNSITQKYGCTGIEMETSAVFSAASLVGIQSAAILMVSDVTPTGKNLFSGRIEEDHKRRYYVRSSVLSKIILETLYDV